MQANKMPFLQKMYHKKCTHAPQMSRIGPDCKFCLDVINFLAADNFSLLKSCLELVNITFSGR